MIFSVVFFSVFLSHTLKYLFQLNQGCSGGSPHLIFIELTSIFEAANQNGLNIPSHMVREVK